MQDVIPLLPVRLGRWILAGLALLAMGLFILWAFLLRGERAYVIEADTQGMTIVFDRSAVSSWRLTDVTICRRIPGGEGGGARMCDGRLFSEVRMPLLEIEWPAGTGIEVERHRADGALAIRIAETARKLPEAAGEPLPRGSLIFIAADGWAAAGALTFSGLATIGAIPGPGSRDLLLSGRYEIREELAGRLGTLVTIKEGVLFPGDSVTLVGLGDKADDAPGEPADTTRKVPKALTGYLLRRQSGDPRSGFKVVAFSALDDVGLKIGRLNAEPAIVTASWSDRALRDPWLLGLAAMLGLLSTIAALVSRFWPSGDD